MKATIQVSDRMTIEVDESKLEDMLKKVSSINEFFKDTECGACKSKNISPSVATRGGFEFVEMVCNNSKCNCRLSYGRQQNPEKTLYPRRWEIHHEGKLKGKPKLDKDGKKVWLPNNGWKKYVPEEEEVD